MSIYEICDLTVTRTDRHGEVWDLNADGRPCRTLSDLVDLIKDLHAEGAFDAPTEIWLLSKIQLGECEFCGSGIFGDHPHLNCTLDAKADDVWAEIAEHHDSDCEFVISRGMSA